MWECQEEILRSSPITERPEIDDVKRTYQGVRFGRLLWVGEGRLCTFKACRVRDQNSVYAVRRDAHAAGVRLRQFQNQEHRTGYAKRTERRHGDGRAAGL